MNTGVLSKIILFIFIAILAACNNYQLKKRLNSLDDSITNYDVTLRWALYKDAYKYHVSPNGTQPPVNLDRLQEVSVTGLEITDKIINEDQTEALVKTVVSYFIKTEGNVRKLKLDQKWWYNESNKQWFIDGEFPKF